jgi:hypothetical protein
MDQTVNEIEAHIDRTRERLGSNLRELEDKVDAATDWREHFRERPHLFLGAAFLGGILLASALKPKSAGGSLSAASPVTRGSGSVQAQAAELWSHMQSALVGVASARLKQYIGELLPDFDEHYRRAEHRAATLTSQGTQAEAAHHRA